MRLRRWLTMMALLTAVGIAVSRPQDVARVATSYVSPIFAQQVLRPAEPSGAPLPDYIPGDHQLTFSDEYGRTGAGAVAAADVQRAREALVVLPQATATTTAAMSPAPESAPRAIQLLSDQPAPAAAPAAAAIMPVARDDDHAASPATGTTTTAAITIEPDPTLTGVPPTTAPSRPLIAAKTLFGAATAPAPLAARSIGTYARGCLAGGVALPVDGPAWQAMRLSRNRNWGHPHLVELVERLALEAQKIDHWPGLLVGDISQPRGGPMMTGHASHQVGLDADVWLTPMPDHRLSKREREEINATSMLDATDIAVDPKIFTPAHVQLIKRAASYPEVERVLVHPAIKKALCEAAGPDRKWLGKVRPIGGHYYHFHIRIACPPGSTTCAPQKPPTGEDGCGKEVQEWLARLAPSKTPPASKPPGYKPPLPASPITLAQLPKECTAVLESGPDGVNVPAEAKLDLKSIARAPAALRPHLRKIQSAAKR